MATTTNYSWTTPDDTALVKDGAAAIRSLGTAIDTTVFNNASAAIAKTIVDAKGDIIAATAADTVSRLAVGANNTVLTADSSTATGLKWAAAATGGIATWSLINTGGTALTGAQSITVSGISAKQIMVFVVAASSATAGVDITVRPNNSTDTADYSGFGLSNYTAATYYPPGAGTIANDFGTINRYRLGYMGNSAADSITGSVFIDSADTTQWKRVNVIGGANATNDNQIQYAYNGIFKSTSAITSITVFSAAGNLDAGTVFIYGGN